MWLNRLRVCRALGVLGFVSSLDDTIHAWVDVPGGPSIKSKTSLLLPLSSIAPSCILDPDPQSKMSSLESQNPFPVNDLIAVVTGGGTGIGLMMAKALATNGALAVYILGHKPAPLQAAAAAAVRPSTPPSIPSNFSAALKHSPHHLRRDFQILSPKRSRYHHPKKRAHQPPHLQRRHRSPAHLSPSPRSNIHHQRSPHLPLRRHASRASRRSTSYERNGCITYDFRIYWASIWRQ